MMWNYIILLFLAIGLMISSCENAENQPPTISFATPEDSSFYMQGEIIDFSVLVEDPENDVKEVRFYVNDVGRTSDQTWPYTYSWETNVNDLGTYTIKAEAIDNDGGEGEATIYVTIGQNAPNASFTFFPRVGLTETVFNFDAAGVNDLEDSPAELMVRWDWENDGTWDTEYSSIKTITKQFNQVGTHIVKLEVLDTDGAIRDTINLIKIIDDTVIDVDGNIYGVIQIGNQIWLEENLKVTHYRDGSEIPLELDNEVWLTMTSEAFCYYDNDINNATIYGALYNGYAVNSSINLAPEGWHVPSDEEWKELEMFLGMSQEEANRDHRRGTNEGSKLGGQPDLWVDGQLKNDPDFAASGFDALPGAGRQGPGGSGQFVHINFISYLWSATETSADSAWHRNLNFNYSQIERYSYPKTMGMSVRCVVD